MKNDKLEYLILKELKKHPGSSPQDISRRNKLTLDKYFTDRIRNKILFFKIKKGLVRDIGSGYSLTSRGKKLLQSYAKS